MLSFCWFPRSTRSRARLAKYKAAMKISYKRELLDDMLLRYFHFATSSLNNMVV